MLDKVEVFCKKNNVFQRGDRLVVACSGGPDSLALLHVFLRLRAVYDLDLICAHFEHGIRGAASLADADFVADFCQQHAVAFRLGAADVPVWAKRHHQSLETAARTLRYQFLTQVKETMGAARILTAHHADDQAETVLMHLLRGTGSEGLMGMCVVRGAIARPFLSVTRAEIESYCARHGLQPRQDATNAVLDCTRNRLRLELLPELRTTYNPEITQALCRLANVMTEEQSYLQQVTSQLVRDLTEKRSDGIWLDVQAFLQQPKALQRRLLRRLLAADTARETVGFEHIDEVLTLLSRQQTGKSLSLPGQRHVSLSYGRARFWQGTAAKAVQADSLCLQVPGKTELPWCGMILQAEIVDAWQPTVSAAEMYADLDLLENRLMVRTRRPGDRLRMEYGTKKLKDLLTDSKIPREARDRLPVVCSGNEILWIAGCRRSDMAKVSKGTKRILHLWMLNKDK